MRGMKRCSLLTYVRNYLKYALLVRPNRVVGVKPLANWRSMTIRRECLLSGANNFVGHLIRCVTVAVISDAIY